MEAEGVDDSFKKFGRRCPERKGRELERVADSSRGFLCRKPARGESVSKAEGSGGTKTPLRQTRFLKQKGQGILTDTPEKRTQSLGAELRKGETEDISRGEGGRACKAVQYRKRAKPLPMPQGIGLRPREGDVGDVHLGGGEKRGEAWDRQGPRGRFTR